MNNKTRTTVSNNSAPGRTSGCSSPSNGALVDLGAPHALGSFYDSGLARKKGWPRTADAPAECGRISWQDSMRKRTNGKTVQAFFLNFPGTHLAPRPSPAYASTSSSSKICFFSPIRACLSSLGVGKESGCYVLTVRRQSS